MNLPAHYRIEPVIRTLADELATARAILLRYESAVTPLIAETDAAHRDIQGFDLALQMLNDIEYISRTVADHLPDGIASESPMQMPGLALERSKHSLRVSAGIETSRRPPEPSNTVDLF